MIIFIQFPLADIRKFSENAKQLTLSKPSWPSPRPYSEFIRGFGQVRPRGKGGVCGWVNENEICNANRAIKFTNLSYFYKCVSRHFYFDGCAVGKFEIVFVTRPSQITLFLPGQLEPILEHILRTETTINTSFLEKKSKPLISIGSSLASLYLFSSTKKDSYNEVIEKKWIIPGDPFIFIECSYKDFYYPIIEKAKKVTLPQYNISILYWWHKIDGKRIRIWLLKYGSNDKDSLKKGRIIRLYLNRLHTEYQCLISVCNSIDENTVCLKSETSEFDMLQWYLREVTRRIDKNSKRTTDLCNTDEIEKLVKQSLDKIEPGRRDAVLKKLEIAKVRPQIHTKLNNILISQHFHSDVYGVTGNVEESIQINPNSAKIDFKNMSKEPKVQMIFNAPVKTAAGNVEGSLIVNPTPKTPTEAAQEIQQLLTQLSQTYPTNTETEKQIFVAQVEEAIKTDSRLRSILIAGGIELIKVFCPPLSIPIEMGRKWLETAKQIDFAES